LHATAVRRLTGNDHLDLDFATTWPTYDLDPKTRAMLTYASQLTEAPSTVGSLEIQALRDVGWSDRDVWELTALVSFFNFSGRMEAASGLPPDEIPPGANFVEGQER